MEIKLTEKTRKRLQKYMEFLELHPQQFHDVLIKSNITDTNDIEDIRKEFIQVVGLTLIRGYYKDGREFKKRLTQLEDYYHSWISSYKNN